MILQDHFILSTVLVLLIVLLNACDGQETGGVASLSWNPVTSASPISYTVHYGKFSSAQAGACDYEYSVDVPEPYATITGLEFDTQYYFAVSAFNGQRSLCSQEVSKRTSILAIEPS
jgi:Fibronectin type III domain